MIISNSGTAKITHNSSNLVGLLISFGPFFFILDITKAINITITTFANSDGWIENDPNVNQLVAPDIGSVNSTAIKTNIMIPYNTSDALAIVS